MELVLALALIVISLGGFATSVVLAVVLFGSAPR